MSAPVLCELCGRAHDPGIVAAVSARLFEGGGDIREAHQFDDAETDRFFMRVVFRLDAAHGVEPLRVAFAPVAEKFGMTWRLRAQADRQRVHSPPLHIGERDVEQGDEAAGEEQEPVDRRQ